MSSERVVVVLTEPPSLPPPEPAGAIEAVFTGADALRQAIKTDVEWLWLLETGVRPDRGALEHLLEGSRPSAHAAGSLVAGM
ncbi:MAG TPA: hypothetical protein VKR21_16360, partial [Solirubrobacteraceae bacterium]|nr:hypothetical protein [Solirubrobacteraceae bacterium]